jgi:hypothetical protein
MRNDARPVGPVDPLDASHDREPSGQSSDSRDSHRHDRQSHIVHPRAEEDARRDDHDADPTMPTGDSTLNTKI